MGPRDPWNSYPFNLLDPEATGWAAPNLPLFPGAPATGASTATSAPAVGAPPWLQPLHETQQSALSPNPYDPASSGDTAASPWPSSDWSATARIPTAAPPYADRAASNPYLGSPAGAGELDPDRTRRLLAEARRAYDFAAWISGDPSVRSVPKGYVAPAADALRPGAPTTGIDDAVDQPAPVNPPPASSLSQLRLFAAPRLAQGSTPLAPALLPLVTPQTSQASNRSVLSRSDPLLTGGDRGVVNSPSATPTWPQVPNSYAGEPDPARTRRLLAEAKRAYDFADWISRGPSVPSAQPMGYVGAATNAARTITPSPGMPSADIDQRFDGIVGPPPPQNQLGPASDGLFVQSSGWPSPWASTDAALPPTVVAASYRAPPDVGDQNGGATIPSPWPDSLLWPGSPSAMEGARNFFRNVHDLIDALGKWFNLSEAEKEACHKQYEYDEKQCYDNHSYNLDALNGCLGRAKIILDQCLRGVPEVRPWTDVDTDGVKIPKRSKKRR